MKASDRKCPNASTKVHKVMWYNLQESYTVRPCEEDGGGRQEPSYVLFWISMAQAQRMIDDSNVQMPNVRAWSPFTVEVK